MTSAIAEETSEAAIAEIVFLGGEDFVLLLGEVIGKYI